MLAPTNNTAWGRGGEEQPHGQPVNVTHPPSPLSHQHKQAATSLQLLARGWWCGCVKHASPSPSPPAHTPTHLMTQRWRSVRGREEEEEEEVEWEGQPSAAPMDAVRVTRHHSCTTVPAHEEWDSEGERRSECGHQMCADHTLCMACMACSHHPNHTFDTVTTPCRWHVNRQRGRRGREKREEGAAHSFPPTSRWHTPPLISSPSLFPSPSSSLSLTHNTHSHHHPH